MIEVRNSGDQAAASVEVRAVLVDGTIAVEKAQATFDDVAAGSTARGGLIFAEDSTGHRLQVKPGVLPSLERATSAQNKMQS